MCDPYGSGSNATAIQFLGAVPKTRTDLLPHYSRLVAILDTYMPDVAAGLIEVVRSV